MIGCATGVLGVSELAALATGAPLVVPALLPHYDRVRPPVHGGTVPEAIDAVRALLTGSHQHDPEAARRWACDAHGVSRVVNRVARRSTPWWRPTPARVRRAAITQPASQPAEVPGLARSGQRPYVRDVILRDGGRTNRGALFVAGPAAPERFDGRP